MFVGPYVIIFFLAGLVLVSLFAASYVLDLQLEVLKERKLRHQLERQLEAAHRRIPRPIEAERQ